MNGKLNIHPSKIIQKLKLYLSVSKNPDSLVTIQPVPIPFLSPAPRHTPLTRVSCTNFDTDLQERAQACFWPRHLNGLPCGLLKQVRTTDRLVLDLKLKKKRLQPTLLARKLSLLKPRHHPDFLGSHL